MYSTHTIKAAAATLTVGFLLAIAFAGSVQAGNGTPKGLSSQERKAVQARSEAWNRFYHLDADNRAAQELKALEARSEAWNRFYHLGTYSSAVAAAEARRSDAMNRYYHLGRYAVIRMTSPFVWRDAGIGAGAMLGVLMVAGALAVVIRRRGAGRATLSSTS